LYCLNSLYKYRLEDEDLEIAPIFNEQNLQYREKFTPNIPDQQEIEHLRKLQEDEGYRQAKLEKKLRKQRRLENFNKKYQGQYTELEEMIQDFKFTANGDDKFYRPILEQHEKDQSRIRELDMQRMKLTELHRKQQEEVLTNLNFRNGLGNGNRNSSSAQVGVSQGNLRRGGRLTSLVRKNGNSSASIQKQGNPRRGAWPGLANEEQNSSIEEISRYGTNKPNRRGEDMRAKQEGDMSNNRLDTERAAMPDGRELCPLGCGRQFAEGLLQRHMAICQQVFTTKKPPVDMKAKRWAKHYKR
jgi:hypothetical protein